ncbi:MAG: tRNA 2-thiouridine(34) synthase MnmA [Rickettsiaceae bacterium H1]|nr:tRNA 2-thiouridine(34) synthase MnmA [Rickettsiaceae bacterium H1]
MSGGIDSSTVAACLSKLGYQVIGVTLQLYNGNTKVKKGSCCSGQDIYDAKSIAEKFNFPHYVLNYESLFKQKVINDFVDTYLKGETPIPCVRCNQTVKFEDLLKVARNLQANALVTGHYVRRVIIKNKIEMHTAKDLNKDQSYFLFATTKEQLEFLRFPLGEITKEQTRKIAVSLGIEIATKPDSQDICFVQEGSYSNLVKKLRPNSLKTGKIIHVNGKVLGEHKGIINYTIGQRKGLKISSAEPLYVIKIKPESNDVIVGPKQALAKNIVYVREVNLIDKSNFSKNANIEVKLRYRTKKAKARIISYDKDEIKLQLQKEQYGVAPGQACVFYQDSRVLGGGWIYESK